MMKLLLAATAVAAISAPAFAQNSMSDAPMTASKTTMTKHMTHKKHTTHHKMAKKSTMSSNSMDAGNTQ